MNTVHVCIIINKMRGDDWIPADDRLSCDGGVAGLRGGNTVVSLCVCICPLPH